jgi:hypothetical protein
MHQGQMFSVEVGILCHKPQGNELLERCLQSLIRVEAGVKYNLILQLDPVSHAENWNRLMERANADFICVLEDDTAALRPFWLRSLVETMYLRPDAAIVMPIETKDGTIPDNGFRPWLDSISPVHSTFGFCNVLRRKAGLRADENLTYFVDIDLSRQAWENGWSCYCNGHVWLLHGAPTGRVTSPDKQEEGLEEKQKPDRDYLADKWKGKIQFSSQETV